MPRRVAKPSRRLIEHKLSQGYLPADILDVHNYLTTYRQREPYPLERSVYGHRKLSTKDLTRVYDRWRVRARRHPGSEEGVQFQERRTRNQERVAEHRVKMTQRAELGLSAPPEPVGAASAGMAYRVTHREHYRERFEEGSP